MLCNRKQCTMKPSMTVVGFTLYEQRKKEIIIDFHCPVHLDTKSPVVSSSSNHTTRSEHILKRLLLKNWGLSASLPHHINVNTALLNIVQNLKYQITYPQLCSPTHICI